MHASAAAQGTAAAYALLSCPARMAKGELHTAMVARPAMKVALPRKTWYGASTSRLLWLNLGHRKPVAPRTNCAKADTVPHRMLSADPPLSSSTSRAATLHHHQMPYKKQPRIGMRMAYKTAPSVQDHCLQPAAVSRPPLPLTAQARTLQPPARPHGEAGNDT